jgi:hypothetical protein
MTRYLGGTKVESGYYVNTRSLAVVTLAAEGMLPGDDRDRFARVPWPLLLVAAPVLGGLFVLAYPVVGAATLAYGLAKKGLGLAGSTAKDLAAGLATPPHAVGEAHLTGKPGPGEELRDPAIEDLEREIRERRQGEQAKK